MSSSSSSTTAQNPPQNPALSRNNSTSQTTIVATAAIQGGSTTNGGKKQNFSVSCGLSIRWSSEKCTSGIPAFGSAWERKYSIYKFEGGKLQYDKKTDNEMELKDSFGMFLKSPFDCVAAYASPVTDAASFVEWLRTACLTASMVAVGGASTGISAAAITLSGTINLSGIWYGYPILGIVAATGAVVGLLVGLVLYSFFRKGNRGRAMDIAWFHHAFLKLSCVSADGKKLYCTLEKNAGGIVIQISDDEKQILENMGREPRTGLYRNALETANCKPGQRPCDVINWLLFNSTEHERPYHILGDNCKDFAKRVFKSVANEKAYPSWRQIKRKMYAEMLTRQDQNEDQYLDQTQIHQDQNDDLDLDLD